MVIAEKGLDKLKTIDLLISNNRLPTMKILAPV